MMKEDIPVQKLICYMSSTHMHCKDDWIRCIENAKEMGFDGVELFAGEGSVNFVDMDEERCMAIARRAEELGMRISAHPWIEWVDLPEEELLSRYRAMIECCIRMGMKEINMHLHFLSDRKKGMDRVFAATDPCLEMLKEAGATLLYENVPDLGIRALGSEVMDFDRLFRYYGPEAPIRMNIDTGHAHIMHQTAPLSEDYGDRWVYTHIDDNDGLVDLHVAPGAGAVDFEAFARAARENGYGGILMMEYHETGLAEGMPVLASAYAKHGYSLPEIRPC